MASRKGKREKQSKTPEVSTVDEQQKEKELIPGRGIYETQWLRILESDSSSCFIREIVQEVFEASFVECYHKTCDRSSFSNTVNWSKLLMLETIECYFLANDAEVAGKGSWSEDDEPDSSVVDSWARGIIPLQDPLISVTKSLEEVNTSEKHQNNHPGTEDIIEVDTNIPSAHVSFLVGSPVEKVSHASHPPRPVASRKRKPVVPVVMKIMDDDEEVYLEQPSRECYASAIRSHTPSSPTLRLAITPDTTSVLDKVPKSVKQTSEVVVNQSGKVSITKQLDTRKFPSQSIETQIKISHSPIVSKDKQLLSTKQSSQKLQRNRIYSKQTNILPIPYSNSTEKGGIKRVDSNRYPKRPSLPPLVDIIDPLPGVTVKEEGRSIVGYGSLSYSLRSPRNHLKPITPLKKDMQAKVGTGPSVKTY